MKYSVVHSNDPYLLARLATDLQMSGVKNDEVWNDIFNPFSRSNATSYLAVGQPYYENKISFYNHDGAGSPIRYELTKSNYLTVLEAILCD